MLIGELVKLEMGADVPPCALARSSLMVDVPKLASAVKKHFVALLHNAGLSMIHSAELRAHFEQVAL
jgi:hypothetical protein